MTSLIVKYFYLKFRFNLKIIFLIYILTNKSAIYDHSTFLSKNISINLGKLRSRPGYFELRQFESKVKLAKIFMPHQSSKNETKVLKQGYFVHIR